MESLTRGACCRLGLASLLLIVSEDDARLNRGKATKAKGRGWMKSARARARVFSAPGDAPLFSSARV